MKKFIKSSSLAFLLGLFIFVPLQAFAYTVPVDPGTGSGTTTNSPTTSTVNSITAYAAGGYVNVEWNIQPGARGYYVYINGKKTSLLRPILYSNVESYNVKEPVGTYSISVSYVNQSGKEIFIPGSVTVIV